MSSDLDQQLARLHLLTGASPGPEVAKKKVGPAVPPKPRKAQPQVPVVSKSYSLKGPVEPSFSGRGTAQPLYSNVPDYNGSEYSNCNNSSASNYSNQSNYSTVSNDYSNVANYSNLSNYGNMSNYGNLSNYSDIDTLNTAPSVSASAGGGEEDEELPPPPPPEPSEYQQPGSGNSYPPPPEELPPPPSPVSSSYSELRRATNRGLPYTDSGYPPEYGQQYATYGPSSQSSTYESIYEPINPRPPSEMSSRSNYSLYNPYVSPKAKGLAPAPTNQPLANPDKYGKEAEVDALTNLLVQSMENSGDPEFFGICSKCGEKVVGEGNDCTAMDQVYHIQCFTCHVCQIQLQGKPFYAMDGKPYCEEDYLNSLEKCSVCTKPILDRILRATGKPYHPLCFTCVVCGKSLDGIPFTVDATNQIHCIDDFHKKFAPRCCVCKDPIMPEPGQEETVRVVALDRSFHVNCYKCEDCGLILSSEAEGRGCYPLDDHVLCKSCNAKRVQALTSRMTTEL